MRVGLCGYPGSGKSTVFAALAPGGGAERGGVAYGNIKVPDARIEELSKIFNPKKKIFAEITFIDVGGGGRADTGAFPPEVVQNMRNADVLVHVVRGFDNPMLMEAPQPDRDRNHFNEEIALLDLSILERRQERWVKERHKGPEVEVNDRCVDHLMEGLPLRSLELNENNLETLASIQLLSLRPLITLYNLSEEAWEDPAFADKRELTVSGTGEVSLAICGSIEAEIAGLEPDEQTEFLEALGLGEPARNIFIQAAYKLLDLISFLTVGPDECRAWPIRRGTIARKAAGKIHSDIERGFIRAETYTHSHMMEYGSEAALKSAGKTRLEGKEYVVQDGDVINFRFNV